MDNHDSVVDNYRERRRRNQESKRWAFKDGQPWTEDDDMFLLEFWIDVQAQDRDEVTVSQCLERTIESCRVRCEHIRKRLDIQHYTRVETKTTLTVETTRYVGAGDDPEDCWWSPDYYK